MFKPKSKSWFSNCPCSPKLPLFPCVPLCHSFFYFFPLFPWNNRPKSPQNPSIWEGHIIQFIANHYKLQDPYLKFPKDSVQLRITPKKILCGVLGHLLRSNFLLKNGKQSGECVNLYDYHHIWNELRTFVTSGVLGWNFRMLTHIYHSYLA